jgi:hypothetical protein
MTRNAPNEWDAMCQEIENACVLWRFASAFYLAAYFIPGMAQRLANKRLARMFWLRLVELHLYA